tara:strand:+ start:1579 stop:2022 length:444 start_codon:yes stop_codon:yes gene_type:complete
MTPSVIIDSNMTALFFHKNQCLCDLFDFVFDTGVLKLQTGGSKLIEEYQKTPSILQVLSAFEQAGLVQSADREEVDAEEKRLIDEESCASNDQHIIAIARLSNGRVLVSSDQGLCNDFNNPELVSNPRGFVYKNENHFEPMKRRFKL